MTLENSHQTNKTTSKYGISLDILWALVIVLGFLFFTSLIPLPPNDFWWHLKIGEYIYSNHSIPTTNMYAWTLPENQPFYYATWLAELLFYILYRLGGLALITTTRTVLIGISIWLITSESKRRSNSWRIAAVAIAFLCVMITNNLPVRTQMWAWIPFIVTYIILKRFSEGVINHRWLIICPLMMIFWVNVHGSYILGLILIGGFFLGEGLDFYLNILMHYRGVRLAGLAVSAYFPPWRCWLILVSLELSVTRLNCLLIPPVNNLLKNGNHRPRKVLRI